MLLLLLFFFFLFLNAFLTLPDAKPAYPGTGLRRSLRGTRLCCRVLGLGSGVGAEEECEGHVWGGVHPPLQDSAVQVKICRAGVCKVQALVTMGKGGNVHRRRKLEATRRADFNSRFCFNLPLVFLPRNSRCKPGHTDCPLSHPQAFAPLTWSTGSSNRSLCWTTAAKTWCHTTQTCRAPPPWTSPTAPSASATTWATWLKQPARTGFLPKWDPNWKISWWTIPCPPWEWLTPCSPPCLLARQRRVAGGAAWAWRTLTMPVSTCWHTFHKLLWFLISRWNNLPFVEFFWFFFPHCASSVCVRVCIYYIYRIFFSIFVKKLVYSILKLPMPPIYCTAYVQNLWTGFAKNFELVKSTQSNRITDEESVSTGGEGATVGL